MRGRRLRARRLTAAVLSAGGLGALAALVVLGHAPGAGSVAEAAKRKPNVVVLMTDDQTVRDLEVMARTRRVLGGRGVTFRNSFVSYPLCCPSRATFLSGQYPHNHRVLGNRPPNGGYRRFDKGNALPVWLEQAGYRTAHIGKYLNGYGRDVAAGVEPGWTEWYGSVDPSTYLMWGYTLNENGSFRTYGRPGVENPALYQTDVYRRKAIDFIRRQRAANRPFFLSVAFLAPHGESRRSRRARRAGTSVRPVPRHRGRYASKPLPRPPSFNERDVSD